MWSCATYR